MRLIATWLAYWTGLGLFKLSELLSASAERCALYSLRVQRGRSGPWRREGSTWTTGPEIVDPEIQREGGGEERAGPPCNNTRGG